MKLIADKILTRIGPTKVSGKRSFAYPWFDKSWWDSPYMLPVNICCTINDRLDTKYKHIPAQLCIYDNLKETTIAYESTYYHLLHKIVHEQAQQKVKRLWGDLNR